VVEGQTDGLSVGVATGGRDGVAASVLHLLDQVLVTLLGETAALLGVEVDVVGPHLEYLSRGTEVVGEVCRQIEIQANLVVLQGNQWQVKAGVAVEEEQQRQVHAVHVGGISHRGRARSHLAIVNLVRLTQENLGVETEPGLVVLVDALTADGKLHGGDGAPRPPSSCRRWCWWRSSWRRPAQSAADEHYILPTRSPLRAMVTDTRPELEGVPFTVCWIFSIAKLVWRLYTAWKKVTLGCPVRYTS
jgi:hypothetical protein